MFANLMGVKLYLIAVLICIIHIVYHLCVYIIYIVYIVTLGAEHFFKSLLAIQIFSSMNSCPYSLPI